MRHLFYSDVHMKLESLETVSKVFDFILQAAHSLGVIETGGYVYNGGDLFDQRGIIKTSCFDMLYRHRVKWREAGIRHIDNVGNHDQEDRDGEIHPLKIFEEFDWIVCTKPTLIEDVKWVIVPYMKDITEAVKDAKEAKAKALFIHGGVKGAWRNDKSQDPDGFDIAQFKKIPTVFSGHYHYRHKVGNVQYIGSPYQQSFAEKGQDKGIMIFDDQTGETEFHEVPGTPKHYEVEATIDEDGEIICPDIGSTSIDKVKIKITGKSEQIRSLKKDRMIEKLGIDAKSVSMDRIITDETMSRLLIADGKIDVKDVMGKYLDFIQPDLNRKKLMTIGTELINANL